MHHTPGKPGLQEGGFETLRWQCGITGTSRGSHLGFAYLVPWTPQDISFFLCELVPLRPAREHLAEVCFLPGQAQGEMKLLAASGQSVGFQWAGLRPGSSAS